MIRHANIRGFTLVELLIALVVMILGLVSLQRLHIVSLRDNVYALHLTEAVNLAQSTLEKLIATDNDHIQETNQSIGKYQIAVAIEDDQPVTSCKIASVGVHWSEHDQIVSMTLKRIICKP